DPFGAGAVAGVLRRYPVDAQPTPALAQSFLFNDFEFGRGNRDWALAAAHQDPAPGDPAPERRPRPVYKYIFGHSMEDPDNATAGAFHGIELAFVFGTVP